MLDTISGDLFQKLKIFHYILQYGSIGKASAVIHRSPSSVSRQIQQLEEDLGVTLLQRRSEGTFPTREGRQLYAHTLDLFKNLELLLTSVGKMREPEKISGTVKILAAPVTIDCLLPAILPDIHRFYPDVNLEVTRSYGIKQAVKALAAHDYHFAMAVQESFPSLIDFMPVFSTSTALISPPDFPLPEGVESGLHLLEGLPFVCMPESLAISRFVKAHCGRLGITLDIRHVAPNIRCQINMVKAGLGVALVDINHLRAQGEEGVRVTPMPLFPPRVFGIIQRHNAFQPPHVRAVMDLVLARHQNIPPEPPQA